jgi:hypothetical protein
MLGQVGGIFVDSHDHIWITSRPRTLDNNDKYAALNPPQAIAASPRHISWNSICPATSSKAGRPRRGLRMARQRARNTNILKFSKSGKFLLQIGHHGKTGGSSDTANLDRPAGIVVAA